MVIHLTDTSLISGTGICVNLQDEFFQENYVE